MTLLLEFVESCTQTDHSRILGAWQGGNCLKLKIHKLGEEFGLWPWGMRNKAYSPENQHGTEKWRFVR